MKSMAAGSLLSRSDEIRAILRELTHPKGRVNVCASHPPHDADACPARILGPDWRLHHFFWRPEDFGGFPQRLCGGRPLDGMMLDFTGTTPDGGEVRFRVDRSLALQFVDSSAALLSGFPEAIWFQHVEPPATA